MAQGYRLYRALREQIFSHSNTGQLDTCRQSILIATAILVTETFVKTDRIQGRVQTNLKKAVHDRVGFRSCYQCPTYAAVYRLRAYIRCV